jgi:CHASE2 domain-containing sensor protein
VLSGGTRLGVELHATAIFNILHNIFIFKLSPIYNYLIILLLALLAALLYTPVASWLDYKVFFPVPRTDLKIPIPLTIIILGLVYLAVAFIVYKQTKIYLDVCYHLSALVISYALTWLVLKKRFPVKEKAWSLE